MAAARRQGTNLTAFLEDRSVFGDLAQSPRFVEAYVEALELIRAKGVRTALGELARQDLKRVTVGAIGPPALRTESTP